MKTERGKDEKLFTVTRILGRALNGTDNSLFSDNFKGLRLGKSDRLTLFP